MTRVSFVHRRRLVQLTLGLPTYATCITTRLRRGRPPIEFCIWRPLNMSARGAPDTLLVHGSRMTRSMHTRIKTLIEIVSDSEPWRGPEDMHAARCEARPGFSRTHATYTPSPRPTRSIRSASQITPPASSSSPRNAAHPLGRCATVSTDDIIIRSFAHLTARRTRSVNIPYTPSRSSSFLSRYNGPSSGRSHGHPCVAGSGSVAEYTIAPIIQVHAESVRLRHTYRASGAPAMRSTGVNGMPARMTLVAKGRMLVSEPCGNH